MNKKLYGTPEYLADVNTRLVQCLHRDENSSGSQYSAQQEDENGFFIEIDFDDAREPWRYLTQQEFDSLTTEEERPLFVR